MNLGGSREGARPSSPFCAARRTGRLRSIRGQGGGPSGPALVAEPGAVRSCQTVTEDRDVEVFVQNLGESSVSFEVAWWTQAPPLPVRKSLDAVIEAITSALSKAQIEIPSLHVTLTFDEALRTVPENTDEGSGGRSVGEGDRPADSAADKADHG